MEPPMGKDVERDYLAGSLLIAMPNMADPRFERAVIFMCAHTAEHAMGVVVNKPLPDVSFGELLEQMEMDCVAEVADRPVIFGGPVDRERGFVVHTLDYRTEATLPVTPSIGVASSLPNQTPVTRCAV
ncbi:MAG: YqgE/AlgH family protein [Pseudomonadota bacterium]